MGIVSLSGHLICANQSEADAVVELLPEHIQLTQQEPGCLSFQVTPAQDPWTWIVAEQFTDAQAFEAHQQRVSSSHWGQGTAGIKREYRIEGL
ncbi:putative quinol monooxygenase [Glutamicibacter sp.]|uniref:putative quinol monooxygenase n=1 Tax=Glutamicibacter sp. TaxID=1931995 RepID=UPI002FE2F2C9